MKDITYHKLLNNKRFFTAFRMTEVIFQHSPIIEKLMNWQEKKVLVTGAGGFIGSHLAEKLTEQGASVTALVRYNSKGLKGWLDSSSYRDRMEIVAGDVTDQDCIRRIVKGKDVVFHLAALIGIPYSYHAPMSYVKTNIEGSLNLVQAAVEFGVGKYVHTSTSEVYGTARYVPIDENHPLQGQSPYSATKIGADKLVEAFCRSFNLPGVIVRPFNTYGPRQSVRAVIPTIISQCMKKEKIVLGNTLPTRDFNYVGDTVDGFIKAAETDKTTGLTINIGTGREISIGDAAQLIGDLMGKKVEVETQDQRQRPDNSEVERLCADNRLAKEILGWEPTFTLKEGLKLTIEWIEKNIDSLETEAYVI